MLTEYASDSDDYQQELNARIFTSAQRYGTNFNFIPCRRSTNLIDAASDSLNRMDDGCDFSRWRRTYEN